ncbi:hypothetical protein AVEN_116167-1 [Araneus ventricosus]|uniref:Uncharacterized protein n=1 Tax=Araneus ventricosus TaxID=182803 RepID=A0A4Y2G172_ARAVE|nr:hypothetical protein AVEN_73873-1 [Araneus ventricosus]GBO28185.1 hypothetical protein AVEN_116167-1 [Araneus ventricosus]
MNPNFGPEVQVRVAVFSSSTHSQFPFPSARAPADPGRFIGIWAITLARAPLCVWGVVIKGHIMPAPYLQIASAAKIRGFLFGFFHFGP